MKKNNRILEILERMAVLFKEGEMCDWGRVFDQLVIDMSVDPEYTASRIKASYGGMGSLNDVVLYREGEVLVKETNEVEELISELYYLCTPYKK